MCCGRFVLGSNGLSNLMVLYWFWMLVFFTNTFLGMDELPRVRDLPSAYLRVGSVSGRLAWDAMVCPLTAHCLALRPAVMDPGR